MSLETIYDDHNVFRQIIDGQIPHATVYEDDTTLAFMDAYPQSEGHTLVVAKQARATNLLDVDQMTLAALICKTQEVAYAIKRALHPDGIRIMQFNGTAAGQTVFHLHFHILPIFAAMQLGAHSQTAAPLTQLEACAQKIRSKL